MRLFLAACLFCTTTVAVKAQAPVLTLSQQISITGDSSFERGALESLRAIETLLQTQYQYGIGRSLGIFLGIGRTRELTNPAPDERDPNTFADMIGQFATDLDTARATLAQSTVDTAVPFTLDLTSVLFDINQNGRRDTAEGLDRLLVRTMLSAREQRDIEFPLEPVVVRFDGADHAWLTAYTHMLSGLAEGILAFDPSPVFDDLLQSREILQAAEAIPYAFDAKDILAKIDVLEQQRATLNKERSEKIARAKPINDEIAEIRQKLRAAPSPSERDALVARRDALFARLREPEYSSSLIRQDIRRLQAEIEALTAKLPADHQTGITPAQNDFFEQETLDTVYSLITALKQQPKPDRVTKMRAHMRAMLQQNRQFWDALALETDDDREWIGNPEQTSTFGITVTEEMATAWQNILNDAEAVLEGRLLVPHPLMPQEYGINVAAYLDDPAPIDVAAWIHGRGAYPYAAKGPKITQANWQAFVRLTSGRAGRFALFFN